jgi:uncharacterized membrane protein YbhN (UPF0104 family)
MAIVIAGGFTLLVLAASISALSVDAVSGTDLLRLLRLTGDTLARLRWQYTAIVIVLAALHYLSTAIAARAAAGVPLPLGEVLLVQLAAAAANRLTPAGIGGSALTARYFTRRGLDGASAVGAATALAVLGAVSDLLVMTGLVLVVSRLGIRGSTHELAVLTDKVTHLPGQARSPLLWIAIGVLGASAIVLYVARHRAVRSQRWARQFFQPLLRLCRHPADLATLIVASGCTTLILGFAFIATTRMVPGPTPTASLGTLLIAFMLGSAAGSAVPIPAGLGSSEAAFIAVLIGFNVPATNAVEEVLIFRLLTFWVPAAAGIIAIRHLYRRQAL